MYCDKYAIFNLICIKSPRHDAKVCATTGPHSIFSIFLFSYFFQIYTKNHSLQKKYSNQAPSSKNLAESIGSQVFTQVTT